MTRLMGPDAVQDAHSAALSAVPRPSERTQVLVREATSVSLGGATAGCSAEVAACPACTGTWAVTPLQAATNIASRATLASPRWRTTGLRREARLLMSRNGLTAASRLLCSRPLSSVTARLATPHSRWSRLDDCH